MAIILSCLPIGEWKQASEWDFFTPDMSVTIVRVAEKKQELPHLSFYNKGEVIFYVGKKKEGRAAGALD